jgi:hypothetical protein|nr:MAG TPA: Integrase [Caudoviricetes sp.]
MGKRTSSAYWEEKRSRWRIDVQKNGIRKTFYSSVPGRNGKRECHDKADAWLDEGLIDRRKKVKDMAELYIGNLKCTTSKSHWRQYDSHMRNYIIKYIGNVAMEDLNEQHMQMVINKAYMHGLSKKSLSNIRACEQNFIKFCRKSKTTTLMCEDLIIPRQAAPSHKKILQPEDIRKLFTCNNTMSYNKVVSESFVNAWRFEVLTGLRPGEVLGLQKSDIFRSTIHVQRSVNIYGEITSGKNDNACRTFELSPMAVSIVECQLEYLKHSGINSPWLFCGTDGMPPREDYYSKRLKRFCEFNEITVVSPYELRHTFVSIAKELNLGTLQTIVGHSADMDTLGVYGHTVNGELQNAAQNIESLFNDIFEQGKDKKAGAV